MSAFKFPVKDPERCKRWVRAICNPKYNEDTPFEVLQYDRVCSLHFKPGEFHLPLSAEYRRKTMWMKRESASFRTLSSLVQDPRLLKDLLQMNLFKHTGKVL